MNAEKNSVIFYAAVENGFKAPFSETLGQNHARGRNMTQGETHGFFGGSKPRNQETKSESVNVATQAALIESYKPQKRENAADTAQALREQVRQNLLETLGKPAFTALLSSGRIEFPTEDRVILVVGSSFNRTMLTSRYGKRVQSVLSSLLERDIDLRIEVDASLEGTTEPEGTPSSEEMEAPTTRPLPQTRQEHPGNVTEALILVERYGDIMGVIDHAPLFRKITTPVDEGGWGLYPQALTKACKQHSIDGDLVTGLAAVIHTVRFTASYRATRNKARFFWTALRNGNRKED